MLENERSSCRGLRCRPLNEVVAPGESSSYIYIYSSTDSGAHSNLPLGTEV